MSDETGNEVAVLKASLTKARDLLRMVPQGPLRKAADALEAEAAPLLDEVVLTPEQQHAKDSQDLLKRFAAFLSHIGAKPSNDWIEWVDNAQALWDENIKPAQAVKANGSA